MVHLHDMIFSLVLSGVVKIYKHPKAKTLYMSIPSNMVQDSQFIFKPGQKVKIDFDPESKTLTVKPITNEE